MKKIITALASAACLLCAATAHATVYKFDFAATGFSSYIDNFSVPAPQDPVKGSILFTADSFGSPVTSINGIDLMIGDHTYTLDEIGFLDLGDAYLFGANAHGVNTIQSGTNDFYLYASAGSFSFMTYAVAGSNGIWNSNNIAATYTEQTAAVPEPGSLALLLIGAGGLVAMLRRRRV